MCGTQQLCPWENSSFATSLPKVNKRKRFANRQLSMIKLVSPNSTGVKRAQESKILGETSQNPQQEISTKHQM